MVSGNQNYVAMCFPYQVGIQAGLFDSDDIVQERAKPTMTSDKLHMSTKVYLLVQVVKVTTLMN